MGKLRRSSYSMRIEMTPLIDVIFLLLTFFIYSLVMTVHIQTMPVKLATVSGPQAARNQSQPITTLTVGRDGQLYFNKQLVTVEALPDYLAKLATNPQQGRLYIALEAQGDTDRGPLLINLLQLLNHAGITDFTIVGQPTATHSPAPRLPTIPLPDQAPANEQ